MVGSPETVFSLNELKKTISQLPLIESKIKALPFFSALMLIIHSINLIPRLLW